MEHLPHDNFGGFGLPTATLTGNDNARVVARPFHGLVSGLSDGKDVRRPLVDLAAFVLVHILLVIDVQLSVGIHIDTHFPDKGINETGRVPLLQIAEKRVHGDLREEDTVPHPDLLVMEHHGGILKSTVDSQNSSYSVDTKP